MTEPSETDHTGPAREPRASGVRPAAEKVPRDVRPPRLSTRSTYSLFVSLMKIVLPALAVAIILLVLVWPRIMPEDPRFRIGLSDLDPEAAGNLSMVNPRFQGRDSQDQPFSIVAEKATQPKSGTNRIDLAKPKADITLDEGTWIALTADNGIYSRTGKTLDLSGHVSLFHDQGFEMRTARARIDLEQGRASGDAPVTGQGPAGHLEAEGFRVRDRGQTIVFTGSSRLTIYPDELGDRS